VCHASLFLRDGDFGGKCKRTAPLGVLSGRPSSEREQYPGKTASVEAGQRRVKTRGKVSHNFEGSYRDEFGS